MKTTELAQEDLRILVESLEDCPRTCEARQGKPDAPCEDCDAARAVKERLERALVA